MNLYKNDNIIQFVQNSQLTVRNSLGKDLQIGLCKGQNRALYINMKFFMHVDMLH